MKCSFFRWSPPAAKLRIAALVLLPTWVGCGVEPETLQSLAAAANSMQGAGGSQEGGPFSAMTMLNPVLHTGEPDEGQGESSVNGYVLPFPDREDPFHFPEDASLAETPVSTVKRVEVLGFSNVDEPRVLVRTQNGVNSIRVGQKFDGIEVLEIHRPAVKLKIDNLVWTATMFDHGR